MTEIIPLTHDLKEEICEKCLKTFLARDLEVLQIMVDHHKCEIPFIDLKMIAKNHIDYQLKSHYMFSCCPDSKTALKSFQCQKCFYIFMGFKQSNVEEMLYNHKCKISNL